MTATPSLARMIRDGAAQLESVSETTRLDAEILAARLLGLERMEMLAGMRDISLPAGFADGYAAMLRRRAGHEPVAYITGWQAFHNIELKVTPDVLIPRADSETLIDAAEKYFFDPPEKTVCPEPVEGCLADKRASTSSARTVECEQAPATILDLGTGSGALLLAALTLYPGAQGTGIDASKAAVAVAQGNANALGLSTRARMLHRSWRDDSWVKDIGGPYDLILCNPPYVEADALLSPMVADYEPADALYAGPDGMEDYRIVIPQIPALLSPRGIAVFEIGAAQADAVSDLARESQLSATLYHDLSGRPRCVAMCHTGHA